MMKARSDPVPRTLTGHLAGVYVAGLLVACGSAPSEPEPAPESAPAVSFSLEDRSVHAFRDVARVLRHPRCLNCHPAGDRPRVGDERELHQMNVQRGPDNEGRIGMRCDTCHRDANQELPRIPGAPSWHLAPRSMAWEGLDDHELAEALKDRARNGDRSLEDMLEHVTQDELVLWGWEPDPGREAVPMPHAEFSDAFQEWVETGAVSPEPGTTSTF
jgi:hypothetical protein